MTFVVLQKWVFKPENVCAYTDTVLLPRWGLFSQEAFWQEQLELICHGRAHLDWALCLDQLRTNLSPCTDLSEVSLEVAFKVTSWEHAFFEDSPLPSFASGFMHFPLTWSSMMCVRSCLSIFLDWGNFSLRGRCKLFQFCRKGLKRT